MILYWNLPPKDASKLLKLLTPVVDRFSDSILVSNLVPEDHEEGLASCPPPKYSTRS